MLSFGRTFPVSGTVCAEAIFSKRYSTADPSPDQTVGALGHNSPVVTQMAHLADRIPRGLQTG